MKALAVIPAGGQGKRMGMGAPKQYALLGGVPILLYTLKAFQASVSIDEIVLVVPAEDVSSVRELVHHHAAFDKVSAIVPGGRQRQDSVRNGLLALREDHDIVVVHDGVRPFVSDALIREAVTEARNEGAVSAGIPVQDTIKRVGERGYVEETLDREGLWQIQTPQAFRRVLIEDAYRKAYHEGFYGTDDTVLVERMGVRVKMIRGAATNIKITTPEDLVLADAILAGTARWYGCRAEGNGNIP